MTGHQMIASDFSRFSEAIADTVAAVAGAIVGVDDGTRLTATGVVWSADGVIVATSHGVERDEDLAVMMADGAMVPATLIGRDDETDIAVLRIESAGLSPVTHGTDAPRVGELVLAVARPGDSGLAATLGVVSARRETETNGAPEYILYTDAVLYPGFSGGALIAAGSGHFLGLLNRIYGRGMGVALGAPLVERVVATLLTHGRIPRGYLGIRTQLVSLPESLRSNLGLTQETGLLLAHVEPGSPGDTAGLMLGDTLLGIDDSAMEDVGDLRGRLSAGREVNLKLLRGGAVIELNATPSALRG